MRYLKERELDLRRLEDCEEGAGLMLLGGERRQHPRHPHLVPLPPDLRVDLELSKATPILSINLTLQMSMQSKYRKTSS